MKKIALYSRVSKGEQNPEMQHRALISKAEQEGWDYDYFEEKESTRKTRPVKQQLYLRLLKKEYAGIVVWKLDRYARTVQELIREINILHDKGVFFCSVTEGIDLSTAQGTLLFNVLSAFAQFERDMISERTKEGLKHGKKGGKRGKDKKPRRKSGYYRRWAK